MSLLLEKLRDKGRQFLHFLKTEPSIDWDEKGRIIIDGNILNFSHITDYLKDTLQPGKPIEHLESWYAKLSDSVPLSLVHAQRQPYVIKGRDLEKVESQKGFGDQKADTNLKEPQEAVQEPVQESSQEPCQKPAQEPVQEPFQEPFQEPSEKVVQKPSEETSQNSVQQIVIPPGIPNKSPKKFNFKIKWRTLST